MYVSKTDKILFHVFIGCILGLGIHFSFPYMRGIFAQQLIDFSLYAFSLETINSIIFGFAFNLLHAAISAFIPSLIASLLLLKIHNQNILIYYLAPSLSLLIINLNNIITAELYLFTEPPYYSPQLLNPFVIIVVFSCTFYILKKIKMPNKAFKPTPESGAV